MKEVNIQIRFDEEKDKFGFLVERSFEDKSSAMETLKLISALEILKQREIERLQLNKLLIGKN